MYTMYVNICTYTYIYIFIHIRPLFTRFLHEKKALRMVQKGTFNVLIIRPRHKINIADNSILFSLLNMSEFVPLERLHEKQL